MSAARTLPGFAKGAINAYKNSSPRTDLAHGALLNLRFH
jgi:hypothetical protein